MNDTMILLTSIVNTIEAAFYLFIIWTRLVRNDRQGLADLSTVSRGREHPNACFQMCSLGGRRMPDRIIVQGWRKTPTNGKSILLFQIQPQLLITPVRFLNMPNRSFIARMGPMKTINEKKNPTHRCSLGKPVSRWSAETKSAGFNND
ncbi:hypothetical protein ACLB1Q_33645 [Escherichia coli]